MANVRGFSLIEVILIIAILGAVAAAVFPSFVGIGQQAETSAFESVVSAVSDGAQLIRANDMVTNGGAGQYPATLDAVPVGVTCSGANPCFVTVLMQGVTDSNWRKTGALQYVFASGNGDVTCNYNPAIGKLTIAP
jgi:type II secretory pathway pseudopilin PulG